MHVFLCSKNTTQVVVACQGVNRIQIALGDHLCHHHIADQFFDFVLHVACEERDIRVLDHQLGVRAAERPPVLGTFRSFVGDRPRHRCADYPNYDWVSAPCRSFRPAEATACAAAGSRPSCSAKRPSAAGTTWRRSSASTDRGVHSAELTWRRSASSLAVLWVEGPVSMTSAMFCGWMIVAWNEGQEHVQAVGSEEEHRLRVPLV